MAFDVGAVITHFKADLTGLKEGVTQAKEQVNGFKSNVGKFVDGLSDFGNKAAIFTGIAGTAMVLFGKKSVDAFNEAEIALAQTEAVLKSTGNAAGVTKKQVLDLAGSLQNTTMFADEVVQSGENMLLTFTNIGKDIFPQATETMLDMSQALGQDVKGSAIQLGKALQDPILGVTALRRVGVNFTEKQQDMIKSMVNSGKTMEAQKFILAELKTEFGGSAKAAGQTFAGQIEILKNKFGDLQERVGSVISGFVTFMATGDLLPSFLEGLGMDEDDPRLQGLFKLRDFFISFGKWITDNQDMLLTFLKGIGIGLGALMIVGTITGLLNALLNPLMWVVLAVGALYLAWNENFLGIQTITTAVVGWIINIFNTYLVPIFETFKNYLLNVFLPAFTAFWNESIIPIFQAFVTWFMDRWKFIATGLSGTWELIVGIVQLAWSIVSNLIILGLQILTGDWTGAWNTIKNIVSQSWNSIVTIFNGAVNFIKGWGGLVFNELTRPFVDAWNRIQDLVNKIADKLDFTKRHSPSIVDRIKKGVDEANRAFSDLDFNFAVAPQVALAGVSNSPTSNSNLNQITISLAGAIITDNIGATQMGEKIGDSIINRLKAQVRF